MLGFLSGCSLNSAKKRYILAEKLWSNGEYQSAVSEFEKVVRREPHSALGRKALFRMAVTRAIFVGDHEKAIENFELFAQRSPDSESIWIAKKEIGNILFSKLHRYSEAIKHYEAMLKMAQPEAPEDRAKILFQIGRSQFFLSNFEGAKKAFSDVLLLYPHSKIAEKASFQIGETLYTSGEQNPSGLDSEVNVYRKAIKAYQAFLKLFPESTLVPQAKFGIAMALEEMDQLDKAYQLYERLEDEYPSPNVVKIRIARVRERIESRKKKR